MQTAIFKNFSLEPFTGYWDGKPRTFKPGAEILMPDYLARHYAKHLVNRELQRVGKDRCTSPKKPEEVPDFMELFNKAFTLDEEVDTPDNDPVDVQIAMANANRRQPEAKQSGTPIDVEVPGLDEEEDDGEEMFNGKPVERTETQTA